MLPASVNAQLSDFQTCSAAFNISRHYPEELNAKTQMAKSDQTLNKLLITTSVQCLTESMCE